MLFIIKLKKSIGLDVGGNWTLNILFDDKRLY